MIASFSRLSPLFRYSFVAVIYVVLFATSMLAQIQVQRISTPSVVDYPIYEIQLRATKDGQPMALNTTNVLVRENTLIAQPLEVTPLANNIYAVRWKIRTTQEFRTPVQFYVFDNDQVASINGGELGGIPSFVVQVLDEFGVSFKTVREVKFAGEAKDFRIAQLKRLAGNVRIDSITTQTSAFTYSLVGSLQPPQTTTLPFDLGEQLYGIDIEYTPADDSYVRDVLSIYFNDGSIVEIDLIANDLELPEQTSINLISPPKDTSNFLLTPCQEVEFQWNGSVKGSSTEVEITRNKGRTWSRLGESTDTSVTVRISEPLSDSVLFRVSQLATTFEPETIAGDPSAQTVDVNEDNDRFLIGYRNGAILEFSLSNRSEVFRYGDTTLDRSVFAAQYIPNTNQFVVGYSQGQIPFPTTYALEYYDIGNATPTRTVNIPSGYIVKDIMINDDKIILEPASATETQMLVLNTADGSPASTQVYSAPVSAVDFSTESGTLIVTLLNGQIIVYDQDFQEIGRHFFETIPMIVEATISPDSEFIAVASPVPTGNDGGGIAAQAQVFIIDRATDAIILSHRDSPSIKADIATLRFNPTSRFLFYGLESAFDQLGFIELTTGRLQDGISQPNQIGKITDIAFLSDGKTIISTSDGDVTNARYQRLIYPERIVMDSLARIILPEERIAEPILDSTYIGHPSQVLAEDVLCNIGQVQFYWDTLRLDVNEDFKLPATITYDSLGLNECMTVPLDIQPLDTGFREDVLTLETCIEQFSVPVRVYSRPRSFTILSEGYRFDSTCVGETIVRRIPILINNDPVPLPINALNVNDPFNASFRATGDFSPAVSVGPNDTLFADIEFSPRNLGENISTFEILYAGQLLYKGSFSVSGVGIGTDISIEGDIRFLDNETVRPYTITNNSPNDVVLNGVIPDDATLLTVLGTLPQTIAPGQSITIDLQVPVGLSQSSVFRLDVTPCAPVAQVGFGPYNARSTITFPDITADPRERVTIPITFNNIEAQPYNGEQVFEMTFTVNPRMFLPDTIWSDHGTAEIVANTFNAASDKREVTIRITGDFPANGTLAEIAGVAGLAESDQSPLEFVTNGSPWLNAIALNDVTFQNGILRTADIGNGRRLIAPPTPRIKSVHPNPASGVVYVTVETPELDNSEFQSLRRTKLTIVDAFGRTVSTKTIETQNGLSSEHGVDVSSLVEGTYRVILRDEGSKAITPSTALLIILK